MKTLDEHNVARIVLACALTHGARASELAGCDPLSPKALDTADEMLANTHAFPLSTAEARRVAHAIVGAYHDKKVWL